MTFAPGSSHAVDVGTFGHGAGTRDHENPRPMLSSQELSRAHAVHAHRGDFRHQLRCQRRAVRGWWGATCWHPPRVPHTDVPLRHTVSPLVHGRPFQPATAPAHPPAVLLGAALAFGKTQLRLEPCWCVASDRQSRL